MKSQSSIIHWGYDDSAEMQLRLRPLREHWEARGPGMLRYLQKLLPWVELPACVNIRLVDPKNGGGGRVGNDEIEFEAVLANRYPHLPEVARLAWLIFCQASHADEKHSIALLPPTLIAAEYVELARFDKVTLDLALREWLSVYTRLTGASLREWWNVAQVAANDEAAWKREIAKLSQVAP